jgi:hypothetical protein
MCSYTPVEYLMAKTTPTPDVEDDDGDHHAVPL